MLCFAYEFLHFFWCLDKIWSSFGFWNSSSRGCTRLSGATTGPSGFTGQSGGMHRTVRQWAVPAPSDSPAAPTGLSGATGQSGVARAAAPFFLELFFPLCFASTLLFGVFTSGPYSLLADSLQDTPRCGVANEPHVC